MKNKLIFNELLKYYSDKMVYAILAGKRKPSYDVMLELSNIIPFTAWKDIKSFLSNSNNNTKSSITKRPQGQHNG